MALSTEDRLALHELLARYTHLLDYGEVARMGEVWTPDCSFRVDNPQVELDGLEALQEYFGGVVAGLPHVRHAVSNVFVDAVEGGALLSAYLQVVDAGQQKLLMFARYRDFCVRTPAGWRIHRRECISG